jgi:hypothetical protein
MRSRSSWDLRAKDLVYDHGNPADGPTRRQSAAVPRGLRIPGRLKLPFSFTLGRLGVLMGIREAEIAE